MTKGPLDVDLAPPADFPESMGGYHGFQADDNRPPEDDFGP